MPNKVDLFAQTDKPKRAGPPNRMNDLNYSTWMKYQKSFVKNEDLQTLIQKSVEFFTKEIWDGSAKSRSLISAENLDRSSFSFGSRNILFKPEFESTGDLIEELRKLSSKEGKFDHIFLDLRNALRKKEQVDRFLNEEVADFFKLIRQLLNEDRYACVLCPDEYATKEPFPIPWAIAGASRDKLRLRDEKIIIGANQNDIFYQLIFQAANDTSFGPTINSDSLQFDVPKVKFPAWTIPRPRPRKANEVLHPAKFPEELIREFIEIFSHQGDTIFDPMLGTGSTLIAAIEANRNGFGVELNPEYAEISKKRVEDALRPDLFTDLSNQVSCKVFCGDANELTSVDGIESNSVDYCITSPPYWSMLRNPGSENQRNRRNKNLALVYSEDSKDLGNEADYFIFISKLVSIYESVAELLKPDSVITIIIKNVKRNHTVYPIAWDLVDRLCSEHGKYSLIGNTFWCQDDIGLKPFAVGAHWVSNTLHQYCIHLKRN